MCRGDRIETLGIELSGHAAVDKLARRRWLQLVPPDQVHAENWCRNFAQFHRDPVFFRLDCGQDGAHCDLASAGNRSVHFVKRIDRGASEEVAQEALLFSFEQTSVIVTTTRIISSGIVGRSRADAAPAAFSPFAVMAQTLSVR